MKNLIILLSILVLAVAAIFATLHVRKQATVTAAATAEGKGEFGEAATLYAAAFLKLMPSLAVPDVNHSKFMSAPTWKKEMEEYVAWITGSSTPTVDRAKRDELLGAIARNLARIKAANFTNKDSSFSLTPERYTALWNSSFFARNVPVDPAHAPLAASCYSKGIAIVRFSALSSYEYDVALVDTVNNRCTRFKVPPESKTFILARQGSHFLMVTSSIRYPGGKIWRSAPAIIPLTIPDTTRLRATQLETHVVREGTAP